MCNRARQRIPIWRERETQRATQELESLAKMESWKGYPRKERAVLDEHMLVVLEIRQGVFYPRTLAYNKHPGQLALSLRLSRQAAAATDDDEFESTMTRCWMWGRSAGGRP